MEIKINKTTLHLCEYHLTKSGGHPPETISLETKTYFLHDICHYVIEKYLNYAEGFWGMLSKGYTLKELAGKTNTLTKELRFIEQIVGPVQSVYWGHISRQNFKLFVKHLNYPLPDTFLDDCLLEVESILNTWQQLSVGQQITLEWNL